MARFQGGANAGHTLKLGGVTFVGHIVPSGCLHKNIELYIGNGVVVDVVSLINEIKQLQDLGFDVTKRLYISNRAKLVSFLHPFLDQADEFMRNKLGGKIQSTNPDTGAPLTNVPNKGRPHFSNNVAHNCIFASKAAINITGILLV